MFYWYFSKMHICLDNTDQHEREQWSTCKRRQHCLGVSDSMHQRPRLHWDRLVSFHVSR